jgi:sugar phosphate isomerase/epimerase
MTTRRKFIRNVAAGTGLTAISPLFSFVADNNDHLKKIGYISGILKNNLNEGDWKAVMRKTAGYGFTEYEGGFLGESPEDFLKYCNEIGIKPVAGGCKLSQNMDEVKESLDKLNDLKMKYAVIYWPWLVGGPFNLEDCKRSADLLNKIGELTKKNGLKLCWHNHNKEFIEMEEGLPFDYLMKHTDKDLVKCEMDIYWVKKGGADPLSVLKQYRGCFEILHVKDMANDEDQTFECPGSGIIDFPSIFDEARKQGIQHYFVERDKAVDGLACLKSSGEYLQNLRF